MVKRPVISVIKTHYKAKIINTVLLFQRFLKSHPMQMDPLKYEPIYTCNNKCQRWHCRSLRNGVIISTVHSTEPDIQIF